MGGGVLEAVGGLAESLVTTMVTRGLPTYQEVILKYYDRAITSVKPQSGGVGWGLNPSLRGKGFL